MSTIHQMINHLDQQELESRPQIEQQNIEKRGIFVFDLPNEIINDFYDLKEYIRIANTQAKMRVLSIASSLPGEGASTIATYLSFLMAGGLVEKLNQKEELPKDDFVQNKITQKLNKMFTEEFQNIHFNVPKNSKHTFDFNTEEKVQRKKQQNILLVDANMHRPKLHRYFGLEADNGLAEILEFNKDWQDLAKPIKDSNLEIITAGQTSMNPVELLSRESFQQVLQEWQDMYRYVIFNSPPVLSYVDALTLSSIVDGVVLVVSAGKTRWEVAQNAKRKLLAAQSKLLGVALNRRKMDIPDGLYQRLV